MDADIGTFPELNYLTLRAELAERRYVDLMRENLRLRGLAAEQLRHMHEIGRAFRPRGGITYPGGSPAAPSAASLPSR